MYSVTQIQKLIIFKLKNFRSKSYYGEPSEYKLQEENVVLVSDENLKWKHLPANSKYNV
jgi:hypothetical protein